MQRRIATVLVMGCLLFPVASRAAAPADTDAYVAHAMQTFGVPGLSLAIVENGGTALAKGYGVRKVGTEDITTVTPITKAVKGTAGLKFEDLKDLTGVFALAGGVPIKMGNDVLGGVGVGGAPGGEKDEACASAGLGKVADQLK